MDSSGGKEGVTQASEDPKVIVSGGTVIKKMSGCFIFVKFVW